MARFLADENVPQPVVDALRRLGHDVATLLDLGYANQRVPDQAVLDIAFGERRLLLTLNRRDFVHLHQDGRDHRGIVVCTVDLDFERQARRIAEATDEYSQQDRPKLFRVNRPG